ncbi:MAG: TonB family protein [Deltaproteobacteria bacterium]|nr:TonB family protein [Deltaproteobacteria bacterium]
MTQEPLLDVLLRRPEPKAGLVVGVVVAVVVHLALIPGSAALPVRPAGQRAGFFASALSLSAASKPKNRLEMTIAPSASSAAKKPEEPPEPEPRGQVVSLPAKKEEKPLAADFLSETDQKTERETRARITGMTENHTRAPSEGSKKENPMTGDASSSTKSLQTDQKNGGPAGDGASRSGDAAMWDSKDPGGGAPKLALEIPRIQKLKATDIEETDDGRIKNREEQQGLDGNSGRLRLVMGAERALPSDRGQGEGSGGVGRAGGNGDDGDPGRLSVPSVAEIERMAGLPANDHLLLEEDDETSLNAFQWKHATYFNRVADAIRRVWVGGEVLGQNDPDGRIFGFEDRLTMIEVTVDTSGNIVELIVKGPSGAGPLDDEALRSFRVAGPFPHPPEALFKGRDRFSFSFGFAVNYNRSTLDLNWRPY